MLTRLFFGHKDTKKLEHKDRKQKIFMIVFIKNVNIAKITHRDSRLLPTFLYLCTRLTKMLMAG